ncbi:MAG: chemotaxis protein MotB [Clostridiales bacterium]|nr:MAG: chemotaxis protein MotB [Clostridiales bacterium]
MLRRKKKKQERGGSPAWMTTFSDLMTLLLTFFILLYSFSTLDAIKFKNVASALQNVLLGEAKPTIFQNDIPPGEAPINDPLPIEQTKVEDMNTELAQLYKIVSEYVENENLQAEISVRTDRRGVIIDIKERVLFDSGKAVLKEESKEVLGKVFTLIQQFENELIIEGHTDNMPIHTSEFPSNWELSVIRAVNVLRYFTEIMDVEPGRISAAGYGKYRPIAPNENSVGRGLNRRVNILILVDAEKEEINLVR